ncbi:MAG: ABC transporter substrate-binding protein [Spirochaetaceae bacterium]|jgi:glycine betaine/proline transport system substrate-binding protein|nr:ABC transporter substrate-binding protein [Spirochaetaceae bacterium]
MKLTKLILLCVVVLSMGFFVSCDQTEEVQTIMFGDASWDSVQVHNRITGFIIENGIGGYKVDYTPGDTLPIANGLTQGDINVFMESWHSNWPEVYAKGIADGTIVDLGKNLPDAPQGWYIPRYLVEGDDAQAPGLKSIADLAQYANLFPDPEDRNKGIIYGGVAGWSQMIYSEELFNTNGLEDSFNLAIAGSGAALAGTMVGAYEKKEPWIGYYWEPTAVLGKLDMIRLAGTEYEAAKVNILVSNDMLEMAPEVVAFLKNYTTTVADNNEFLAMMDSEGWDSQQAAQWFLKNKEDVWTQWVSPEVAEKVKAAL